MKKKSFLLLTALISVINMQYASGEKPVFLAKPYIQNPKPDAMTIMWITDKNCRSWVEFGENGILSERAETIIDGLVETNHINKVKLEQLKPNTQYSYKVISRYIEDFKPYKVMYGDTIESDVYTFRTPDKTAKEVNALILNDVHDRPTSISHLIGLNKDNPYDFVVFNGDMFDYIKDEAQIVSNLLQPAIDIFASEKPFVYVRGNHETRGVFARKFYDYVDNDAAYFSFTWGPAHFIVLDTGEDKPDTTGVYAGLVAFDDYRVKQARWLEQQLKSNICKKAKFRVVIMHMPHYHSDDWHGTQHCRQLFGDLFNKHKVDILVSGHTHTHGVYAPQKGEHNYPIIIGGGSKDGRRTLIQLHVDEKNLIVSMLNDSGDEIGKYEIKK